VRRMRLLLTVVTLTLPMMVFGGMAMAQGQGAIAQLADSKGNSVGQAQFTEGPNGVRVAVQVQGLTPGEHGIHIHEKGDCSSSDFKSAGEHFNPTNAQHGLVNPDGPHGGDLPNLVVDQNGNASAEGTTNRVTLSGSADSSVFHSGGTALVIHEKADDQKTDPAGDSGDRVACGVIEKSALPSSGGVSVPLLTAFVVGCIGAFGAAMFVGRRVLQSSRRS
jgi:Cu-Zn family superoxide dismutase